jgi:hypothetical protein
VHVIVAVTKPQETCAAKPKPDTATVEFIGRSGLVPGRDGAVRTATGWGIIRHLAGAGQRRSILPQARIAQLRVAAEWHAPIGRNAKEAAWIKAVAGFMPEAVPGLLGEDRAAGMFAMRYLPTETYPNWKAQLARGEVAPAAAAAVGARLARIHAELARRPESREEFATDDTFRAIRLEPYLLATARPIRTSAVCCPGKTAAGCSFGQIRFECVIDQFALDRPRQFKAVIEHRDDIGLLHGAFARHVGEQPPQLGSDLFPGFDPARHHCPL